MHPCVQLICHCRLSSNYQDQIPAWHLRSTWLLPDRKHKLHLSVFHPKVTANDNTVGSYESSILFYFTLNGVITGPRDPSGIGAGEVLCLPRFAFVLVLSVILPQLGESLKEPGMAKLRRTGFTRCVLSCDVLRKSARDVFTL